jgi:hypothetical protein
LQNPPKSYSKTVPKFATIFVFKFCHIYSVFIKTKVSVSKFLNSAQKILVSSMKIFLFHFGNMLPFLKRLDMGGGSAIKGKRQRLR